MPDDAESVLVLRLDKLGADASIQRTATEPVLLEVDALAGRVFSVSLDGAIWASP
jgi:hypothetical protein